MSVRARPVPEVVKSCLTLSRFLARAVLSAAALRAKVLSWPLEAMPRSVMLLMAPVALAGDGRRPSGAIGWRSGRCRNRRVRRPGTVLPLESTVEAVWDLMKFWTVL